MIKYQYYIARLNSWFIHKNSCVQMYVRGKGGVLSAGALPGWTRCPPSPYHHLYNVIASGDCC